MGLAALALETNPVWPTFPARMPDADVTAGLVLPNAAVAMLGSGGAVACLILMVLCPPASLESKANGFVQVHGCDEHFQC